MGEPLDPRKDPGNKKILVIDDDKSACVFFKSLLNIEGFRVETAYEGEAALRLMKSSSYHQFDLAILDLLMPKYSGYEVLKELQKPGYQDVPIFIATAKVLDQGTVEMLNSESNVREFCAKPVNTKAFKGKIHEILGTVPIVKDLL